MNLISLVGEQPIPILLPELFLKPDCHYLLCTEKTENVADRLDKLCGTSEIILVSAYNFDLLRQNLEEKFRFEEGRWNFNLTGGTKMMALAAYSIAAEWQIPFIYIESERRRNILNKYAFDNNSLSRCDKKTLPKLLTIDQYLQAHLPGYEEIGYAKDEDSGKVNSGGRFERAIHNVLKKSQVIDDMKVGVRPEGVGEQIEIDLIVQIKNQFGLIEVKTGQSGKEAIGQLTTAGSRDYLGTYTHRFLVSGRNLDKRAKTLANEENIHVIELPDYYDNRLEQHDADMLVRRITEKMQPRRR